MARARRYVVQTKKKTYFALDKWMTALEMKAFGWHYKGSKTEDAGYYNVTVDYDRGTATARRAFYTYVEFRRDKPYSRNFFFGLLEFFMNVLSWIRRFLIIPIWVIAIILFVIGLVTCKETGADTIMGMNPCIFASLLTLVCTYIPSLLFCLLGWGFRKIFKVDERHRADLIANGYDPDDGL